MIASDPVSPDITIDAEALAVLERYGLEAPAVRNYLGAEREKPEGAGADAERTDVV